MVKTKIMPGEMFIVEYVNGGLVNRWAINDSNDYITLGVGRKASTGFTDLLVQETGKELIEARYHVTGNVEAIKFVSDVPIGTQSFAQVSLAVLKVKKTTEIFDRFGAPIGTIPADSLIGTTNGVAGNSNRNLMVANAFNDGTGWKFINQISYSYGFVNVHSGFSLQKYSPNKNLETAVNAVPEVVDWDLVAQVIANSNPEATLRGDLNPLSKEEIITTIDDYFAKTDLSQATLMDPIQFFSNIKNKNFIERELTALNPIEATKFTLVANDFNA